ncbi:MAG TPA: hypothetical protein VNF71_15260 [Acidimicrobiales bacterium]|nr:hypothetical protein [Acidimicrobiales bacterium]
MEPEQEAGPQTTGVPPRRSASGSRKTPPASNAGNRTANRAASKTANRGPRRARRGRSQGRFYGILVGLVLAIVAVVVIVLVTSGGSGSTPNSKQPAVNFSANGVKVYGTLGPEGVPLEVGQPLAAANTGLTGATIDGVQCNTSEQLVYHHHVHIAIFINGQPRSLPLGIGMVPPAQVSKTSKGYFADGSASCLYWIHVHAQDGIVHIESPEVRTYLLAQIFGIWRQPLSATQIGPYTGHVTATVNGQPWEGDPTEIPLDEHAQIVLNLNGPAVNPPPISWQGTSL